MMNPKYLMLVNLGCTLFMTGVIWVIQLVHYPSFRFVEPSQFKNFHTFHSNQITFIVAPIMLLELLTAYFLVYLDRQSYLNWFNFLTVVLIFALTAFISVPVHNKLGLVGYDSDLINQLTRENWWRTLLWSLRLMVLGYFCIYK